MNNREKSSDGPRYNSTANTKKHKRRGKKPERKFSQEEEEEIRINLPQKVYEKKPLSPKHENQDEEENKQEPQQDTAELQCFICCFDFDFETRRPRSFIGCTHPAAICETCIKKTLFQGNNVYKCPLFCERTKHGGFAEEFFPKDIKTILRMEEKEVKESIQAMWKTVNLEDKFNDICNKGDRLCQIYKDLYTGKFNPREKFEKLIEDIEKLLEKDVNEFYDKLIKHINSQRSSIKVEIASHIKILEDEYRNNRLFSDSRELQNNLSNLISQFGNSTPNTMIPRLFEALDGIKNHDILYDMLYEKWTHIVFNPNNLLTELRLGELVDIKKIRAEVQADKEIEIKTGLSVQIDTDLGLVSLPLTYKNIDMAINSFQDPHILQSCNTINLNLSHLPAIEHKFESLKTSQISKFSNLRELSLTWANLEKVGQCVQELQGLKYLESLKLDFFSSEYLDDAYINGLCQIMGNITSLKTLGLNISKSSKISDASVDAICKFTLNLPKIKSLLLNLENCKNLTVKAIENFVTLKQSKSLQRIALNLQNCSGLPQSYVLDLSNKIGSVLRVKI